MGITGGGHLEGAVKQHPSRPLPKSEHGCFSGAMLAIRRFEVQCEHSCSGSYGRCVTGCSSGRGWCRCKGAERSHIQGARFQGQRFQEREMRAARDARMMDVWSSGTVLRRTVCAVGQRSCKTPRNGARSSAITLCISYGPIKCTGRWCGVQSHVALQCAPKTRTSHCHEKTRTLSTLIVVPRMYVQSIG